MPNQPKTPARAIRIPEQLWRRALAVASERDESVSQIVRAALERYVKRYE